MHIEKYISFLCTFYNKDTLQLLFIFNVAVLIIFSYNTILTNVICQQRNNF